jgi:hypothetical protein
MSELEGYFIYFHKSCGLCKWHEQKMVYSGTNPVYDHFCSNPKVKNNVLGGFMGINHFTPEWCPVGEMEDCNGWMGNEEKE